MWNQQQQQPQNKEIIKKEGSVAVAIDKDKGSQYALKWAVDNVLNKGQTVTLLHVRQRQSANQSHSSPSMPLSYDVNEEVARSVRSYAESQAREIFLPFRCFCSRKDVKCNEIILENTDISKALIDYCHINAIEIMIASASSRNQLVEATNGRAYGEIGMPDCDISFVGSPWPNNNNERVSVDRPSYERASIEVMDFGLGLAFYWIRRGPFKSRDDLESEMRRLRLELKQTMDMYNAACKEALTAKQKATEAAQRLADLEAQKRVHAERKAYRETEERKKALEGLNHGEARYRRYSIGEIEAATNYFSESLQIGEGGYGPVYKCNIDHTTAAIKLHKASKHGTPVGCMPEYGCLVYEYMSNGSLEDRLFCRGGTPPLSWQIRFRVAAEIATGLLFLHQTKPEPLVHRDLKPANILLDQNFVSKISDVGLARLVPPSVADSVTQYRMTQAAGTFCYIDPEYQQTGMLGTKSDIYSLGILFLQIITAKPAMGLTHHVQRAIERGTLGEMLDPVIHDWPYEETLQLLSFH
ncbi:U-box domain-containing protein 35 [Bienertia sinuspersici]